MVDYYTADIINAQDYYPFGSIMPGRNWSNEEYRFGFNGQEKDNEVKGQGNSLDFNFRIYDARLAKFLSLDPIARQYPMLTPYQFASNRPIDGVDIEGKEWKSQHKWSDKITDKAHIEALGTDYVKDMTYQQAWGKMAPKLLETKKGEVYDCADLTLTVLVEFAYTFKLSVHIEDYKGGKDKDPVFDNDNYGYTDKAGKKKTFEEGDWKGLANAIAGDYGAADLYNNNLVATDKSFDNLQAGDLVGWKYNSGAYHSQTVTEVGDSFWFDYDDDNDYYKTIQGSLSDGKGVPAYEKTYDIKDTETAADGFFSRVAGTKARTWNFTYFDKNK